MRMVASFTMETDMNIQQYVINELSNEELDAVGGGDKVASQSGNPNTNNFYNSPSFRADYAFYPHTLMA